MDIIVPQPINLEPVTFSRASIASTRDTGGFFEIVAANTSRFDYFKDQNNKSVFNGFLIEPRRTNYLVNTASSLVPGSGIPVQLQNQTVSLGSLGSNKPTKMTLSFFGNSNSKVTVSGGGFVYELVGSSDTTRPVYKTFPVRADNLSIEVTGLVYAANLEGLVGFSSINDENLLTKMTRPTSWIPTTGTPSTREADTISNSGILWSSFIETTPAWDSSTTYSIGERVDKDYIVWASSSDSNINNVPSPESNFWVKVKSVNTVAMLDRAENSSSSQEQGTSGAYFCYSNKINSPAKFLDINASGIKTFFDSAALFEVNAKFFDLVVSVSTNAGVFTKVVQGTTFSGSVANTGVMDDVYEFLENYISMEVYNCTVSVRIHNELNIFGETISPTDVVSVNELVFGVAENLGRTAYGMRTGIVDYSKKETNEFGVTSFVRRGFSKTMSCNVYVENEDYNRVVETLQSVLAEPTAWIGTEVDGYSNGALIFGAFKDYTLTISYPTYSMLNIEVQGLVV